MYPVDENGIPGTMGDDRYYDGGDSAAICGTLWALGRRIIGLNEFTGWNAPVRHPDHTKWYGKEDRFSRDQLIPMICAGIAAFQHPKIDCIFTWHKSKWFLTAWNTVGNFDDGKPQWPDITGPEIWSLWIRYKKPWWGYPLLYVFDIQTFIGAIQWRWFPKNQLCRNHMLVSLAMKTWPTVWSWLVNKINDWHALTAVWGEHCFRAYEYDTSDWFSYAVFGGEKPVVEEQKYKTRVT